MFVSALGFECARVCMFVSGLVCSCECTWQPDL